MRRDGREQFASMLVERFTTYHRRSYVCKSGLDDVMIGAVAQIAECNGVEKASHIKDKLTEMTHLNETIYATGIASSYQSKLTKPHANATDFKKKLARELAGIDKKKREEILSEIADYFGKVFDTEV